MTTSDKNCGAARHPFVKVIAYALNKELSKQ